MDENYLYIGAYVKLICKNGLIEAGKLVSKTKTEWVLQHIDKSHTIIMNPQDNVLAVKTFNNEVKKDEPDTIESDTIESDTIEPDTSDVYVDEELKPEKYHRREDLRAFELAELYKLKAHEERKRARELVLSHKPSKILNDEHYDIDGVNFGTPQLPKPVSYNPIQEARRRLRRNKETSLK